MQGSGAQVATLESGLYLVYLPGWQPFTLKTSVSHWDNPIEMQWPPNGPPFTATSVALYGLPRFTLIYSLPSFLLMF